VPGIYLGFGLTLALGLLVAFVAHRLAPRLDHLNARLAPRATSAILVGFIVAYCVVFGTLSLLRHESFHSKADLAVYSQVVWTTSRGQFFTSTIAQDFDSPATTNFLSDHFVPILAFVAPLYWVFPDARVLLILQTIALALGVLPIYWLARQRLPMPFPLLLSLAYLLLPSLHFVNLFDFHVIALVTPLLSFATYSLVQRRYGLFAIFVWLALLCQEEVAFIVVGLGLYLILAQRRFVSGMALVVGGLFWGYALLNWIMPAFGRREFFYLWRYGYLGHSVGEMALTLLTRPDLVLAHLLTESRLRFVLHQLIPFGLVSLVGLDVLALAGIPLAYLLLSVYEPMHSIQWQYTAPLIPFLTLAAVLGCARLLQRWPSPGFRWALASFLLVTSGASYVLVSPAPLGAYFDPHLYDVNDPHAVAAQEAVALIPADSPVMVQSDLLSHLSERALIREYPLTPDLNEVEYVVCNPQGQLYGFPSHEAMYRNLARLGANPCYERVFDREDIIVFRRRNFTPQVARRVNFGDTLIFLGYDLSADYPPAGDVARVTMYWRSAHRMHKHHKYFVHLIDRKGRTIAQDDREPGNWRYPTPDWIQGETVPERYEFPLPAGVKPGDCRLRIGVYAIETGERLPILGPAGEPQGTELLLDWP
jgi:uncharacterized membrane protein